MKKLHYLMIGCLSMPVIANDFVVKISQSDAIYKIEAPVLTPPDPNYITIPSMTNYTNGYGTAISKTEYNSVDYYPAWKAFDGLNSINHEDSFLSERDSKTNEWVGFVFNEAKKVRSLHFYRSKVYPFGTAKDVMVEYSDDGSNWNRASSDFQTDIQHINKQEIAVTETSAHTHWRLFMKNNHENTLGYTLLPGEYNEVSSYFIAVGEVNFEFEE